MRFDGTFPIRTRPEPSVHQAGRSFHGMAQLAYGFGRGVLPFRQPAVLLRFVHDAAFQFHAGKRFPVLRESGLCLPSRGTPQAFG